MFNIIFTQSTSVERILIIYARVCPVFATSPLLSNTCAEKHVLECVHLGFLWCKILAIQRICEKRFILRMYFFLVLNCSNSLKIFFLNCSIVENRANNFVVTKVYAKYS